MSIEHTPGPWTFDTRTNKVEGNGRTYSEIGKAQPMMICESIISGMPLTYEEEKANLELILSAPTLAATVASQSSELSKLREEHNRLGVKFDKELTRWNDRNLKLEHSLTEKEAEIKRLKAKITEKRDLAFERMEIITAKDKELAELREYKAWAERDEAELKKVRKHRDTLRKSNRELVEALNKIHWLEPVTHDEWGEAVAYTKVKKIAEEALLKSQTPTE